LAELRNGSYFDDPTDFRLHSPWQQKLLPKKVNREKSHMSELWLRQIRLHIFLDLALNQGRKIAKLEKGMQTMHMLEPSFA